MNVALFKAVAALPPEQRAGALSQAIHSGSVPPKDAAEIARSLAFPGWQAFDGATLASVGAQPFGALSQPTTSGARPLGASSPMFVNSAFTAADAKAAQVTQLLGDDDHAKQILTILGGATPQELSRILSKIDCNALFATVHDHKFLGIPIGHHYGTQLGELLTSDANLAAMDVGVRTAIVDGMQRTDHGDVPSGLQKAITRVFVGTLGADLTALKNGVDLGDDQNNMHNLVYRSIDHADLRAQLLAHFAAEAVPTGQFKGVFDVDDTFYASFIDDSFPHGTVYPGTLAWHQELDRGPSGDDRLGDNTFLSARPHDHLGLDEKSTLATLHGKGEGPAAVVTGDLLHLIGNAAIAAKKIANFGELSPIYPEYRKVFEGDSGQGDVRVAIALAQNYPGDVAGLFIHELPGHATDPALRAQAEALGVVFHRTRVGQATSAYQAGIIGGEALERIIAAAQNDLAQVDFGVDGAKKSARQAELSQDVAAAQAALGGG